MEQLYLGNIAYEEDEEKLKEIFQEEWIENKPLLQDKLHLESGLLLEGD